MTAAPSFGKSASQLRIKSMGHWLLDCNAEWKNGVSDLDWRFAPLAQAHDLIEHSLRNFPFRRLGNLHDFVVRDDGYLIAIGVESDPFASNIVHYDGVELLGGKLLPGVFQNIL